MSFILDKDNEIYEQACVAIELKMILERIADNNATKYKTILTLR
jgi:hypothetical protein